MTERSTDRHYDRLDNAGALAGLMVFLALVLCAAPADAQDKDLVAVVNGHELKSVHLDRTLERILPAAIFHGGITPEVKARNLKKAMTELVDDELLYQEAIGMGLQPDTEAVEKEKAETIARMGGRETFERVLKHHGITEDEYGRMVSKPAVVEKVLATLVDGRAVLSPDEAREYYEKNKDSHFMVEKRRFRHLIVETDPGDPSTWDEKEKLANEAHDKIIKGMDFADAVKEYSAGVRKDDGGDTGLLDKSQILPELSSIGWELKPGEVSKVIRTIYGFHIIRLEEAPPAVIIPFDEVRTQIERTLIQIKKQRLRYELISRLRGKAKIKVIADE